MLSFQSHHSLFHLTSPLTQFYEKDDKMMPGKKGISLTLEQYQILRDAIVGGGIDDAIKKIEEE